MATPTFQDWWNHAFFKTDLPFYGSYRRLHSLGADLDYVEHLRNVFYLGEFIEKIQKDEYAKKRKTPPIPKWLVEVLKRAYGKILVGYTLKELHPEVNESRLYRVLKRADEITSNAWDVFYPVLLDSISNEHRKRAVHEKIPEDTRQVLRESALLPLMVLARPEPPKRGNPSDAWGTLFLLALTEHMHERTKTRYYYGDAYNRLEKLRADFASMAAKDSPQKKGERAPHKRNTDSDAVPLSAQGQTAMTRIKKYKARLDWCLHLQLLKRSYLDSKPKPNT